MHSACTVVGFANAATARQQRDLGLALGLPDTDTRYQVPRTRYYSEISGTVPGTWYRRTSTCYHSTLYLLGLYHRAYMGQKKGVLPYIITSYSGMYWHDLDVVLKSRYQILLYMK